MFKQLPSLGFLNFPIWLIKKRKPKFEKKAVKIYGCHGNLKPIWPGLLSVCEPGEGGGF